MVAETAFETAHLLLVSFALGDFAVVVDPSSGARHAHLRQGDDVQSVIQLAIAVTGQPMPRLAGAGDFYRHASYRVSPPKSPGQRRPPRRRRLPLSARRHGAASARSLPRNAAYVLPWFSVSLPALIRANRTLKPGGRNHRGQATSSFVCEAPVPALNRPPSSTPCLFAHHEAPLMPPSQPSGSLPFLSPCSTSFRAIGGSDSIQSTSWT